MSYTFNLQVLTENWEELAQGALLTLSLSASAMAISLVLAVFGAIGRLSRFAWIRRTVLFYVEIIRNTPFLVQIFLIFFGLPAIGIRVDPNTGALVAMVLNGTAYAIEIVRTGIESVGRGQLEAASALGLHRIHILRRVVLPQALGAVFVPLGSQFILLMLGSSLVSSISADELTAAANDIQSRTFRIFEAYIAAGAIYFVFSLLFSAVFHLLDRAMFSYPGRGRSCAR